MHVASNWEATGIWRLNRGGLQARVEDTYTAKKLENGKDLTMLFGLIKHIHGHNSNMLCEIEASGG